MRILENSLSIFHVTRINALLSELLCNLIKRTQSGSEPPTPLLPEERWPKTGMVGVDGGFLPQSVTVLTDDRPVASCNC